MHSDGTALRWTRLGFGACVAVWTAGCAGLPRTAVEQIKQADRAYRAGRFTEATALAGRTIAAHPEHPDTAEAYCLRGLSSLKTGDRAKARSDLRRASQLCERRELACLLNIQLANLDYEDGAYAQAAGGYARSMDHLPAALSSAELWFRYGNALQRSGRFRQAKEAFGRVVADHPSSHLAAPSRAKLAWPHDYFAVQCGAFSRRASAEDAARELRLQGLEAVTSLRPHHPEAPYVVIAGRYQAYSTAVQALPAIRRFQPDAFVVP